MSDHHEPSSRTLLQVFLERIASLFHLWDQTDHGGTIATITENIEFRGASVWSLMIAILLASIGLNTNSVALIIGAMLVSPLMGPIMGAGMALGIYDIPLLRRSLTNLTLMTGISLFISFSYFSLSPLRGATPELLSRTVPTFFDVLVALLGGSAMIIAVSRKSRSTNTIAGVAVATALMPPLCTAGYGLASQDLAILAGSTYLYLINTVFIGLTTFLFTKYLRLSPVNLKQGINFTRKRIMVLVAVALVFLAPSVYMAYDVIQETSFQTKVDRFVGLNMQFSDSQITSVVKKRGHPHSLIQVTIAGSTLSKEMVDHLQAQLPEFGLADSELKIVQYGAGAATPEPSKEIGSLAELEGLSEKLARLTDRSLILQDVSQEIGVLFPRVESFSWGDLLVSRSERIDPERRYTIIVTWRGGVPPNAETDRLSVYLKLRLKTEQLNVLNL